MVAPASAQIDILFDAGYTAGERLTEQQAPWELWTSKFPAPEVRADTRGRVGAFSAGEESRAILPIESIQSGKGIVELEFTASIPNARSHSAGFVQIGLGDSAGRLKANPVVTVSITDLLLGNDIGIEGMQKAYLNGEEFRPTPNQTIHIRCRFNAGSKTASISISKDEGGSFSELAASPDGAPFTFDPLPAYDRIYLRLGSSTATGVYLIKLTQR